MRPRNVKLSEVKAGDELIADDGFTCMPSGPCQVFADDEGFLFVHCKAGHHYLDGQLQDRTLVGFTKKEPD